MAEGTRASLQKMLAERYQHLLRRLSRHLGSEALAGEALHETYIRLGRGGELDDVSNAEAYLFRATINTAHNIRVSERRSRTVLEMDAALDVPDDTPPPDRAIQANEQLAVVVAALNELPERQKVAFLESYVGSTPTEVLAQRYNVAVRTIQADIRAAVVHCAKRLGRKEVLANDRVRLSKK
jgi:RNA polymerase sigma factor (sigma-70 family)